MLVSQILRTKGDTVFTIKPADTVGSVAELLHSRGIGALVVMDAERVAGIVSERDVVRAIASQGAAAMKRPVADFMTVNVLFADPGETVDSLLSRMTDRRIRHLPVCKAERLVGIVSIGDLVKWKISEVEAEADGLKAYIAAS
ncbi:MAG: CBS domain-containing protein [Phenylobacterium sp.]|uniref:CBS domain-containing protein n=1 Tax=Phenylobacterium sp. TaxID=1871053 RepID=UPI00120C519E|nr:CBS domain-containing protein [Phenylobacterium sp.]TAJ69304.1 MAG: CBS domain-containing protein [Phenylobacterium sp.]